MNSDAPLSMKEVRSALLLASKDVNVIFQCRCGRTTRWPQTYGDHLLKCQQHGYKYAYLNGQRHFLKISQQGLVIVAHDATWTRHCSLIVEESSAKETPSKALDESVVIDGKPRRKSAIKAATTFSQFAEDELDSTMKPAARNGVSKGPATRDDDDFKISEGDFDRLHCIDINH